MSDERERRIRSGMAMHLRQVYDEHRLHNSVQSLYGEVSDMLDRILAQEGDTDALISECDKLIVRIWKESTQ